MAEGWVGSCRRELLDHVIPANQRHLRRLRFDDDQRRRLAARAKALVLRLLSELATIVTPETLLRWHRRLIAGKYNASAKPAAGRPRTTTELAALVVRMETENRDWGYRRIQGAPSNPGHTVARGTIANILKKHLHRASARTEPADDMEGLLDSALGTIMAADFFTVGVSTRRGLQRFLLLFFIELSTRR